MKLKLKKSIRGDRISKKEFWKEINEIKRRSEENNPFKVIYTTRGLLSWYIMIFFIGLSVILLANL